MHRAEDSSGCTSKAGRQCRCVGTGNVRFSFVLVRHPSGSSDRLRELLTFLDFTSGNDLPEMIAKVALACVAGAAQAAVPSDKIASLPGWPQNEQVRLYRNPGCDAQPYHPGSSASPPTLPKTTVPFRPYCPVPTMYSGYLTSTTGSSRRSLTPRTCLWCTGPTADREARVSMPDCSPRVRIAPR